MVPYCSHWLCNKHWCSEGRGELSIRAFCIPSPARVIVTVDRRPSRCSLCIRPFISFRMSIGLSVGAILTCAWCFGPSVWTFFHLQRVIDPVMDDTGSQPWTFFPKRADMCIVTCKNPYVFSATLTNLKWPPELYNTALGNYNFCAVYRKIRLFSHREHKPFS